MGTTGLPTAGTETGINLIRMKIGESFHLINGARVGNEVLFSWRPAKSLLT